MISQLTQETTYLLNNMKVADIDTKYVDYIRNHPVLERYNLHDKINDLEFDDNLCYHIGELLCGSKELFVECGGDEFELQLKVDELLVDFKVAYENQLKFEKDPTYDIAPNLDEDTEKELSILLANRIPILVEIDGKLVEKYIDKRFIDGTFN